MLPIKLIGQHRQAAVFQFVGRNAQRQLERLSGITNVRLIADFLLVGRDSIRLEGLTCAHTQGFKLVDQLISTELIDTGDIGLRCLVLYSCCCVTVGAQNARAWRHDNRPGAT